LLAQNADPENGGINYFRFVINPKSFEQSVENMFYFAFLIKDGYAAWDVADDGEPMVFACDPATQADYQNNLRRKQVIAEFDMETWQRAIEVFGIKESIIPMRLPVPPEEKYPKFSGSTRRRPVVDEEEVPLPSQAGDDDDDDD